MCLCTYICACTCICVCVHICVRVHIFTLTRIRVNIDKEVCAWLRCTPISILMCDSVSISYTQSWPRDMSRKMLDSNVVVTRILILFWDSSKRKRYQSVIWLEGAFCTSAWQRFKMCVCSNWFMSRQDISLSLLFEGDRFVRCCLEGSRQLNHLTQPRFSRSMKGLLLKKASRLCRSDDLVRGQPVAWDFYRRSSERSRVYNGFSSKESVSTVTVASRPLK